MSNRTANDTAQDITTAFVTRNDAIDNQEGTGTNMIGNHLQGSRINGGFTTGHMHSLLGCRNEILEQIDFIVAVYVL